MTPRASILVPTHNHASTLALSVGSALGQSVREVEVLIIGDGASPEVRAEANRLVDDDARVRYFDHPKGENHGEIYRDTAIHDAKSDAIFYLCDDDILMPHHVADLLYLLEKHNFVQSKNGYFTIDGTIFPHPGDLSDPSWVAQVLRDDIVFNFVSLTGTAHSRQFYLDAADPWEVTPKRLFPDWFQWRKLMRNPAFSGATSARMTALQFPSSQDGRDGWSGQRRFDEIEKWAKIAASPNGQVVIDELVARGDWDTVVRQALEIVSLNRSIDELGRSIHELGRSIHELRMWMNRPSVRAADNLARFAYRLPILRSSRRRG